MAEWPHSSYLGLFGLFLSNLSISGPIHGPVHQFLAIFFSLWGWGSFWALPQIYRCHHKPWNCKPTTTVWSLKSTRVRGCVIIISLPMPWVCLLCQCVCQHASMPEVCQHARGSSLKWLNFPGCLWGPLRFPDVSDVLKAKILCHCARWLKTHKTVLMA